MAMKIQFIVAIGALAAASMLAYSQTPSPPSPAFDVASVKLNQQCRNADGFSHSSVDIPSPGRFVGINASPRELIGFAYEVKDYQISGHPLLAQDAACYSIEAKAPPETSEKQMRLMVQSLLAERLKLVLHRETRVFPVYELVVSKNGPKLQKAAPDAKGGSSSGGGRTSGWRVTAAKISMTGLAYRLSRDLDRPVFDKTGVEGFYAITLQYGSEDGDNSDRPSIFTALQQQLGLKLDATKRPIEVLIIDHAERVPTEN
jgi:uncharacterized protein (TIGR03435 family)